MILLPATIVREVLHQALLRHGSYPVRTTIRTTPATVGRTADAVVTPDVVSR